MKVKQIIFIFYIITMTLMSWIYVRLEINKIIDIERESYHKTAENVSTLISFPLKIHDRFTIIENISFFAKLLPKGIVIVRSKSLEKPIRVDSSSKIQIKCNNKFYTEYIMFNDKKIGELDFCFEESRVNIQSLSIMPLIFIGILLFLLYLMLYLFIKFRTLAIKKIDIQSKQIAHDIRSPLEALRSVTNSLENLDYTSKQIITNSIGRISDIANGLLKTTKQKDESNTTGNFRILIDDIINDKKFEHNIRIHYRANVDYRDTFLNGRENELYRSISNIVNNAYESQDPDQVRIEIELNKSSVGIELRIKDFGSGMSKKMIDKALLGGTTTKDKGNGLGVSFSKNTIEKHNGSFEIDSIEGKGTTVIIHLPIIETPKWFTDEINILSGSTEVVCVDDDPSFLELYKDKLKNVNKPVITYSEKTIDNARLLKGSQYYFDYDLGNNKTGFDYIIKNNLQSSSTLVTSMHQDEDIQSKCIELGIKILPKQIFNNAQVVQSEVQKINSTASNKVVFIDDDYLMHMSWKMEAQKAGVDLECFHTIDEFLDRADEYDKDTKIYIDSNLKDGVKGEIESEKIARLGFSKLYLATGYSASDIDKPDWIMEVVGKRAKF